MSSGNRPALNSGGDHLAASTEQHQSTRSQRVRQALILQPRNKERRNKHITQGRHPFDFRRPTPSSLQTLAINNNFVKGMIGCARTNFNFLFHLQTKNFSKGQSKDRFRKKHDDSQSVQQLKNELPPVIFKPAPTSDFNIPKPFQIAATTNSRLRVFRASPSNGRNLNPNGIAYYRTWLKTMKKKYAQDNNPKSKAAPADAEEEQRAKEDSAMRRRHRDRRGQIAKMRFATSMSCFPEHPHISVIFNNVDTVSDYEDSTSIEHDPRSILLTWRSNDLNEFVALIDKATTQKAKSKDQHKILAILSRNGTRQPTEEEEEIDKILVASSEIEREAMGIPATEDNRFSLSQAVAELKKRTAYTLISAAATNHNAMQVDFMNANQ
ncbi:hypothetical protein KEM48_004589 [Puccinia striiformis f. sp. tritici PST-130]|nr:hypothetical protein KEM48_004589 [Puccinia striiformis f. sp. tritici PST-130]